MGFSAISMQILQILNQKSPITSGELISMTSSTKSNLSQRLSFLEKEGYIEKILPNDKTDKRKILIQISPSGEKKINDIEKRICKAQISFEKKFSDKELSQHKDFMLKIQKILDEGESELEKIFKF
jgi:DNA-binding MarR family transcriptional regulator